MPNPTLPQPLTRLGGVCSLPLPVLAHVNTRDTTMTTNTNVAHTPGPWMIGEPFKKCVGTTVYRHDEPGKGWRRICRNVSSVEDARLIAASPALLAALQEADAYLMAHQPKGNIRDNFSELNAHACLCKTIHAAIAKATP